nr:MAG TPA: hypothetical protein [Caudoviricetes sp.]
MERRSRSSQTLRARSRPTSEVDTNAAPATGRFLPAAGAVLLYPLRTHSRCISLQLQRLVGMCGDGGN